MAAIVCGVTTLLAVQFGTDRTGWWDPSLWGLDRQRDRVRRVIDDWCQEH